MSVDSFIRIACDICGREGPALGATSNHVRDGEGLIKLARQEGWSCDKVVACDVCPDCLEKEESEKA